MNQSQWLSLARSVIMFVGGFVVSRGTITQDQLMSIVNEIPGVITALTSLGAFGTMVWGLFAHTQKATVMSAAAIPGVEPIRITRTADISLQEVAADSKVPSVVPASKTK